MSQSNFYGICTVLSLWGLGLTAIPLAAQDAPLADHPKEIHCKCIPSPKGLIECGHIAVPFDSKRVTTLRGREYARFDNIIDVAFVPYGTFFAAVSAKKNGSSDLFVYDAMAINHRLHKLDRKRYGNPKAVVYTSDGRAMIVATDTGIYEIDSRTFEPRRNYTASLAPTRIAIMPNGANLAVTDGNVIEIINLEDNTTRCSIPRGAAINDLFYSDDNSLLGVLTADGTLTTYDTRNYAATHKLDNLGAANAGDFSNDGKYVAVAITPTLLQVINLVDQNERESLVIPDGVLSDVCFLLDSNGESVVSYTVLDGVVARYVDMIKPYYGKLVADEVGLRMNEWAKMQPGESMEDYQLRVNDETRAAQMRLFEDEISTQLAGDMLGMSEITLGEYNDSTNELQIQFTNMPPISLPVPKDEAASFTSPSELVFSDVRYGLTDGDKFEIVYAKVRNPRTNREYVYESPERRPLELLKAMDHKLSYEVVQQQQMEEMKLVEIAQEVVTEAKKDKTISDHTHIDVNSQIVPAQDGAGKRILNYDVNFTYDVDPEFSMREDFGPAKYRIQESGAATAMMAIVQKAFEKDFAQYLKQGKKLKITITGSADASPLTKAKRYDGVYGEFTDEPVHRDGKFETITVTRKTGIVDNPELAFIRAQAVRDYMQQHIAPLRDMDTSYDYVIHVSKERGSANRRISVKFSFIDAIKE